MSVPLIDWLITNSVKVTLPKFVVRHDGWDQFIIRLLHRVWRVQHSVHSRAVLIDIECDQPRLKLFRPPRILFVRVQVRLQGDQPGLEPCLVLLTGRTRCITVLIVVKKGQSAVDRPEKRTDPRFHQSGGFVCFFDLKRRKSGKKMKKRHEWVIKKNTSYLLLIK